MQHIDDLFKAKLASREIAYDDSAWAGAEKLLNAHYRWTWLKRFAYFALPVLLITGVGIGYLMSDGSIEQNAVSTPTTSQVENGTIETTITRASSLRMAPTETSSTSAENLALDAQEEIKAEIQQPTARLQRNGNQNIVARNAGSGSVSPDNDSWVEASGEVLAQREKEKASVAMDSRGIHRNTSVRKMPYYQFHRLQYASALPVRLESPFAIKGMVNALRRFELNAQMGALLARGFLNDQSKRDPISIGYYAGMMADYHLNEYFFIESGLALMGRGSLANRDVYSLNGASHESKAIYANYLCIPVTFNYRITTRHAFGFGIQYSQLAAVVVKDQYLKAGETTYTQKLRNDKTGFVNADFAVVARYRYELSPMWSADIQAQYGMTDVTENNGRNKVDDRNALMRIGLSYRMISR